MRALLSDRRRPRNLGRKDGEASGAGTHTGTGFAGMKDVATLIVGIGLLAMGLGLLWPWVERLGLDRLGMGRMPGDIHIDHGDTHLHLPLGTSALIAAVVAIPVLFWKHSLG